ncbi:MAG: hypothetical protein A3G75_06700 [Verrucomicrobia bacterium RIFCSPLOWO2_12_FULL_64_8]|nr:MAG: hypothetical protein A3G75_06700 [Verrucomicrobia bacterium RIFCSPLOWO2_12_FULL_64_8]
MIAAKRREVQVFSLSFMDVICCGFGAVLLIFILTTGRQSHISESDLAQLRTILGRLERELDIERVDNERLAKSMTATNLDLNRVREQNTVEQKKLTTLQQDLKMLLQQATTLNTELSDLRLLKQAVPEEKKETAPVPNAGRENYLSGLKIDGEFVLILLRASGSMLDDTIDGAVARLEDPDYKKREAPKWQRSVQAVQWMIATLDPETHFQVFIFNEDTTALLPNRADDWFSPRDAATVTEVINKLQQLVPRGSANLERAFTTIRYMGRLPDSIVLITDGLPTMSDSVPGQSDVDSNLRIRFFRAAQRTLPARVPINTILFPMSGDPAAPALFWNLAIATRGAMLCPSRDWPNI